MVTLVIDNKTVCVPEGTSILDAARTASIDIPTLCYLKDLNEIGACRICMVEVEGQETLVAACDNEVHEGMVIHTNSQKVRMTRRVNLQLLLSQHEVNCVKCTRSGNCKLQKLSNDYNLLGAPYQKKLRPAPVDYSSPILRFENRCVSFFPTPAAIVSVLTSCVITASVNCSGLTTDKMASAAFGPTPDTEIS